MAIRELWGSKDHQTYVFEAPVAPPVPAGAPGAILGLLFWRRGGGGYFRFSNISDNKNNRRNKMASGLDVAAAREKLMPLARYDEDVAECARRHILHFERRVAEAEEGVSDEPTPA